MIEVEEPNYGEDCDICEKDLAVLYVPAISISLCRRCARKLSLVLRQEVFK